MAFVPNSGSVAAWLQSNNASVITVGSGSVFAVVQGLQGSSVSGTVIANQGTNPWVITGSVQASLTPAANQSVSGTVGASVIGLTPVAVTNIPSISGTVNIGNTVTINSPSVYGNISGSVVAFITNTPAVSVQGTVFVSGSVVTVGSSAPANQSVSGTVGASIIGNIPVVVQSSVATVIIGGSIAASFIPPANQSVSGTVQTQVQASVAVVIIGGSILTSSTQNQSVSGTIGASIVGTVPVTQSGAWTHSVVGTLAVSSLISIPGIVSTANSTTAPVTSTLSFTGTGEEWKDFGSVVINVFTDAASGTDGLSIQQSSDNANWDIRDTYTISSMAAGGGKTFQVQPAARFGRVVYTQGAVNNGAFRLQTIYHPQMVKPTSQRAQDGYTNETDLEQTQDFNMVWNGATWDRMPGAAALGTKVYGSIQGTVGVIGNPSISGTVLVNNGSVVAFQGTSPWVVNYQNSSILAVPVGSVITVFQAPSIVGTYAEDAASASGDKGFLVMGARNDTLSSVTSADGDYSSHVVGPAGELIAENAPLTKWVSGTASMIGGTPVTGSLVPIIAAQGSSVFTYITGVQIANASGTNAWITLLGATNSVIGYTIAPANGGSNIYYQNGLKTNANAAFSASISAVASVYVSAQGFIAKI